ncbi:MAG: alkene reductase [Candidatus Nitronauta litoralis]|uniref:Alkene reductase n=1 Tax=Candidatus Nitronauta litoralis TaxID=2705533 RepID=A0A7T0BVV2_9BACT|nr:MAG: alkene reductase [Candidatus Nitronauta litoralis]
MAKHLLEPEVNNSAREVLENHDARTPYQNRESKKLLSPFQIGDLTLKNRVVLAPMTRARAGRERMANDLMEEYYVQRSTAGLLISEATVISKQGIGWINSPGIYNEEQSQAWKKITKAVHDHESIIFLQLWHTGRASHSAFHDGELPVAPSAIKINGEYIHTPEGKKDFETPRALKESEIPAIVEDHRKGAIRAKEAGFDGIEIHSANGYLLDQFLQSKTNKRTDRYGGSLENRCRLLLEIVTAVTEVWPANRVGVRLSPNGNFNDMGSVDFRETFIYLARQLDKTGLAYLHVIDGLAFGFHELGEPMVLNEFREVFSGPIIGNCGYTQETAENAVKENKADLIAFGRHFISNPDLVDRFRNGWPLAEEADMSSWYSFEKKGYTDFKFYMDES